VFRRAGHGRGHAQGLEDIGCDGNYNVLANNGVNKFGIY
jgi:hypothetical protein